MTTMAHLLTVCVSLCLFCVQQRPQTNRPNASHLVIIISSMEASVSLSVDTFPETVAQHTHDVVVCLFIVVLFLFHKSVL